VCSHRSFAAKTGFFECREFAAIGGIRKPLEQLAEPEPALEFVRGLVDRA